MHSIATCFKGIFWSAGKGGSFQLAQMYTGRDHDDFCLSDLLAEERENATELSRLSFNWCNETNQFEDMAISSFLRGQPLYLKPITPPANYTGMMATFESGGRRIDLLWPFGCPVLVQI